MLHLGFVSAILADHTLEEVISFAAQHGFECVEVMCWPASNSDTRRYAGITHIDVDKLDDAAVAHIQKQLKQHRVSISGLGYYPNPLDPDPARSEFFFEHIKKVIRAAAKLHIPVVNTFVGRDPAKNVADNLQLFADRWPAIIKVAEEHNVKIGIENCPMLFTNDEWPGGKNLATTPAIWDRMFEIIPSRAFGLNYDPSHLVWQMMDEVRPLSTIRPNCPAWAMCAGAISSRPSPRCATEARCASRWKTKPTRAAPPTCAPLF